MYGYIYGYVLLKFKKLYKLKILSGHLINIQQCVEQHSYNIWKNIYIYSVYDLALLNISISHILKVLRPIKTKISPN